MSESKFTYGDRVEVVEYGSWAWRNLGDGKYIKFDAAPYRIGKTGVIRNKVLIQGIWSYAIEEDDGNKSAWYYHDQLKLLQ